MPEIVKWNHITSVPLTLSSFSRPLAVIQSNWQFWMCHQKWHLPYTFVWSVSLFCSSSFDFGATNRSGNNTANDDDKTEISNRPHTYMSSICWLNWVKQDFDPRYQWKPHSPWAPPPNRTKRIRIWISCLSIFRMDVAKNNNSSSRSHDWLRQQ